PDAWGVVFVLRDETLEGSRLLHLPTVRELPGRSLDRLAHAQDRGAIHRDLGGDLLVVPRIHQRPARHDEAELATVDTREPRPIVVHEPAILVHVNVFAEVE